MSVDVTIFKVTLRGSAQIFVKKSTIDKNDMTQFVFIFPTQIKCEYLRGCDMKKLVILCDVCYSSS